MASLFISHSSHDREAAERVAQRLRVEGFAALFSTLTQLMVSRRAATGSGNFSPSCARPMVSFFWPAPPRSPLSGVTPSSALPARWVGRFSAASRGGCSIRVDRRRAVDRPQRRRDCIRPAVFRIATGGVGPGRLVRMGSNSVPIPELGLRGLLLHLSQSSDHSERNRRQVSLPDSGPRSCSASPANRAGPNND